MAVSMPQVSSVSACLGVSLAWAFDPWGRRTVEAGPNTSGGWRGATVEAKVVHEVPCDSCKTIHVLVPRWVLSLIDLNQGVGVTYINFSKAQVLRVFAADEVARERWLTLQALGNVTGRPALEFLQRIAPD